MSKTSLFDKYVANKAETETTQAQVKTLQAEGRDILRQILEKEGKGPHSFGGKMARIIDRKGTLCLFPERGPRVKKAAEKPAAASSGETPAPKAKKASKKAAPTAAPVV